MVAILSIYTTIPMPRSRFTALVPVEDREYGPANKYDPEFCWTVRLMAQEGKFPEEWVSELGVTLKTIYNWANAYPEFEEAMHEAHWLCRAFWAKRARENIQGLGMSPSILAMILERRFGDMWGKNSINLHSHFEERSKEQSENGASLSPLADQEAIRAADVDRLEERIAQLEARRKAAEDGK